MKSKKEYQDSIIKKYLVSIKTERNVAFLCTIITYIACGFLLYWTHSSIIEYIVVAVIFISIGIFGCADCDKPSNSKVIFRRGNNINLMEYNIKGHQYIGSLKGIDVDVFVHDPDCPLCKKQQHDMIVNILDSIIKNK